MDHSTKRVKQDESGGKVGGTQFFGVKRSKAPEMTFTVRYAEKLTYRAVEAEAMEPEENPSKRVKNYSVDDWKQERIRRCRIVSWHLQADMGLVVGPTPQNYDDLPLYDASPKRKKHGI